MVAIQSRLGRVSNFHLLLLLLLLLFLLLLIDLVDYLEIIESAADELDYLVEKLGDALARFGRNLKVLHVFQLLQSLCDELRCALSG